jgi:hypothetical protein
MPHRRRTTYLLTRLATAQNKYNILLARLLQLYAPSDRSDTYPFLWIYPELHTHWACDAPTACEIMNAAASFLSTFYISIASGEAAVQSTL